MSVVALPLLGASWILALIAASENHPMLTPALSIAVLLHAAFSLGGYCFANNRIRQNLFRYGYGVNISLRLHYIRILQIHHEVYGEKGTIIGNGISSRRCKYKQSEYSCPNGMDPTDVTGNMIIIRKFIFPEISPCLSQWPGP